MPGVRRGQRPVHLHLRGQRDLYRRSVLPEHEGLRQYLPSYGVRRDPMSGVRRGERPVHLEL